MLVVAPLLGSGAESSKVIDLIEVWAKSALNAQPQRGVSVNASRGVGGMGAKVFSVGCLG